MTDTAAGLLAQAADLPGLLDAAYEAFDHVLAAARAAEDGAGSLLPAFALAAAAAADGRDAVLCAPSMPASGRARPLPAPPLDTAEAAADYAASLALLLKTLLDRAAAGGAPADQAACANAAACAARIAELLAPPG
jgi:hypothetical protein